MQDPLYERAQQIINIDDEITTILVEMIGKAKVELGETINLQDLIKTILLLPFKHAAFKGGGVKGTAYVGVIKVLERFGLLSQIDTFIGASAGGLTAAFLGLGVPAAKIDSILASFTADEVLDGNDFVSKISNFVKTHGFDTGEGLLEWFMAQLKELKIDPEITLAQHRDQVKDGAPNKKEIILIGTNITTGQRVVISADTMPDCRIADAVRITTSIPGFFNPIYVELDDNNHVIFDTDEQGRKHLRYSYEQDRNNSRQVCLVDGGLIDNIGNDLKNIMGIQNSLMMVFYLLKMKDLPLEEQARLNEELIGRCQLFTSENKSQITRKRDRFRNKLASFVAHTQMLIEGNEEGRQQHRDERAAIKATSALANEAQMATQKQHALIQQNKKMMQSSAMKKTSFFKGLKEKISQVLGTVRKGQERNLEHGVAFIDPVPEFSTIDFDKVQIPPVKEMAITNGIRGAIAMLLAEALPIYLQRHREKNADSPHDEVQRLPQEIASTHAEVLRLAPARWHKFMSKRATSVYWQGGILQMACPLEKLAKLEKCATEYFRYGFTKEITIHTRGDQAFLTVKLQREDLQQKHAKWAGQLGNLRSDVFDQIEETTLRLDFRQTPADDSIFTDPAFSTELISRMKANRL